MAELWKRGFEAVPPDAHTVQIWLARLTEFGSLGDNVVLSLPKDEQQQANRLRIVEARQRYVLGRWLLRTVLSRHLDAATTDLELNYSPHGKPGLADSNLRFNLSHSSDVVMLAVASEIELGIDVEQLRTVTRRDQIAAGIFGPSEMSLYNSLPESNRQQAFFRAWTRKEAIIKANGRGLSFPLTDVEVSLTKERPLLRRYGDLAGEQTPWHVFDIESPHGYMAALATSEVPKQIQQFWWQPDDA